MDSWDEKQVALSVQDPAYWASWAISHWSTMAVSGLLCAIVGTYPFSHSSASVLLAFYWLVVRTQPLTARPVTNLHMMELSSEMHWIRQHQGFDPAMSMKQDIKTSRSVGTCLSPAGGSAHQLCICAVDAVLQEPHRWHLHRCAVCGVHDPRVRLAHHVHVVTCLHAYRSLIKHAAPCYCTSGIKLVIYQVFLCVTLFCAWREGT